MNAKTELVTFRAFSYGGAAACFALLPFLWPVATKSLLDHLALITAACGLPFFVAAGWMADTTMLRYPSADETPRRRGTEFRLRDIVFTIGAGLLFLSVDFELTKVDVWTGGFFLLACIAAMAAKKRHRFLIDDAIYTASFLDVRRETTPEPISGIGRVGGVGGRDA